MSNSMRILQVHTSYRNAGGEDRVVEAQAKLLTDAGHRVERFARSNPDRALSAALALMAAPWNRGAGREAGAAARSLGADVAHVHNTWYAMGPEVVRALSKTMPVVVTLHNYRLTCANAILLRDGSPCRVCVGGSPWPAVRYGCYRDSRTQSAVAAATISFHRRIDTWASVARILVVSEFARGVMTESGLPASKIEVVPNFVEDPGSRSVRPAESRFILCVGRLSPEKGVDLLLKAWREADLENTRLVVAGDGPDREALEAMNVDGVEFLGAVSTEEVTRLMLQARALAFPSRVYEGQPMVITEALAAGLPIVANDFENTKQILGGVGLHAAVADEADLAAALKILIEDDKVDEMGSASRNRYLDRYTPRRALQLLESVYEAAIDRRPVES